MTFEPESAHDTHDALLVAGHVSGDLAPPDAERVERWIRTCRECAALHVDLGSLAAALATLPKAAVAPRDFRLSPADAARLRGGPWWRRLGRSILAPRGVGRPLATAFTTLGLVGLLIGSLPAGSLLLASPSQDRALVTTESSPEAAGPPVPGPLPSPSQNSGYAFDALRPAEDAFDDGSTRAAWQLRSQATGGGSSGGASKDDTDSTLSGHDLTAGGGATGAGNGPNARDVAATTVRPAFVLAVAFLALGLGLFALRRFGRRLA